MSRVPNVIPNESNSLMESTCKNYPRHNPFLSPNRLKSISGGYKFTGTGLKVRVIIDKYGPLSNPNPEKILDKKLTFIDVSVY